MPEGKWEQLNDTHPTINPKDLENKKQHEDYEIEAEVAVEKENDKGFKKLNLDSLNNFFRTHKK
jgi:hypothetical protein